MSKKGRSRLEPTRHDRGLFSSIKRAVMGCFLRASREGPEGDSWELEAPASRNLVQKGIAIGAALGGAGLVPGIVVQGAEIIEGTQIAMERTLENEETSIVSIDQVDKEELREEEAVLLVEGKEQEGGDLLITDPVVAEEVLAASTATSLSMSTSLFYSASNSMSMMASETASTAMSLHESLAGSVSESTSISGSISASESAFLYQKEISQEEEEVSAAEEDYEEEEYEEEYLDEEDWESPAEILEGLWEEFLEEDEDEEPYEPVQEEVIEEEVSKEEEEDLTAVSLSASASASESASERSSMFTSIAVAASELRVEGLSNAAHLESQYGLTDFTALANAMAHENDAVRKSLTASFTLSEGGSENMASILENRSEDMDALSSESAAVSESVRIRESEAARMYLVMLQSMNERSVAEIV